MKVKVEIDVTPILITDGSEENAIRVGKVIEKNKRLDINNYFIVDGGIIILVEGNIGNLRDSLIVDLAGIEFKKSLGFFGKYQESLKVVTFLPDTLAETMISKNERCFYGGLDKKLRTIFS